MFKFVWLVEDKTPTGILLLRMPAKAEKFKNKRCP